MSHEFIEFIFPCNDCLVAAACRERKQIKNEDLTDHPSANGIRCLALRSFDDKTSSYEKSFLEQMANITWRFACQLNEDRRQKIPPQYRHFLIEYLAIFQYIINTTSWHKNLEEVAEFDKVEIKLKMKTAKSMLDWIE